MDSCIGLLQGLSGHWGLSPDSSLGGLCPHSATVDLLSQRAGRAWISAQQVELWLYPCQDIETAMPSGGWFPRAPWGFLGPCTPTPSQASVLVLA